MLKVTYVPSSDDAVSGMWYFCCQTSGRESSSSGLCARLEILFAEKAARLEYRGAWEKRSKKETFYGRHFLYARVYGLPENMHVPPAATPLEPRRGNCLRRRILSWAVEGIFEIKPMHDKNWGTYTKKAPILATHDAENNTYHSG